MEPHSISLLYINDTYDICDGSCDPLQLDRTYISSLSITDDLIIFSDSDIGLQNALNNLKKILLWLAINS